MTTSQKFLVRIANFGEDGSKDLFFKTKESALNEIKVYLKKECDIYFFEGKKLLARRECIFTHPLHLKWI